MSKEIYTSKVINEDGDLVMLMQPELLEEMNFEEDVFYSWQKQSDGSFLVKPVSKSNLS